MHIVAMTTGDLPCFVSTLQQNWYWVGKRPRPGRTVYILLGTVKVLWFTRSAVLLARQQIVMCCSS